MTLLFYYEIQGDWVYEYDNAHTDVATNSSAFEAQVLTLGGSNLNSL